MIKYQTLASSEHTIKLTSLVTIILSPRLYLSWFYVCAGLKEETLCIDVSVCYRSRLNIILSFSKEEPNFTIQKRTVLLEILSLYLPIKLDSSSLWVTYKLSQLSCREYELVLLEYGIKVSN